MKSVEGEEWADGQTRRECVSRRRKREEELVREVGRGERERGTLAEWRELTKVERGDFRADPKIRLG